MSYRTNQHPNPHDGPAPNTEALHDAEIAAAKTQYWNLWVKRSVVAFAVCIGTTMLAAAPSACNKVPDTQVNNAISAGAACVISIVEDLTAVPDIAKTAATCGVTAADIYQIVAELLQNQPDARPDGALGTSQREAHLRQWLDAAGKARAPK